MGLISFLKDTFGWGKNEVKSTEPISKPEAKKESTIDSAVEETKVIKDRMVEVSEKKEEVKVTAKEIKGKSSNTNTNNQPKSPSKPRANPVKKGGSRPAPKQAPKKKTRPTPKKKD